MRFIAIWVSIKRYKMSRVEETGFGGIPGKPVSQKRGKIEKKSGGTETGKDRQFSREDNRRKLWMLGRGILWPIYFHEY